MASLPPSLTARTASAEPDRAALTAASTPPPVSARTRSGQFRLVVVQHLGGAQRARRPARLAVAITRAPRWAASFTRTPPVTPPAPLTNTVSPGRTVMASSAWSAVRAGTGSAAATVISIPPGRASGRPER